jgi:hypothetical protein
MSYASEHALQWQLCCKRLLCHCVFMLFLYHDIVYSVHLHSGGGKPDTIKAELLAAFGAIEDRKPQSLQCIRYDDFNKWDAIGDQRQPLQRDYIWYEPFAMSSTIPTEQNSSSDAFDTQVNCLLQRLATRGISIDSVADTNTDTV